MVSLQSNRTPKTKVAHRFGGGSRALVDPQSGTSLARLKEQVRCPLLGAWKLFLVLHEPGSQLEPYHQSSILSLRDTDSNSASQHSRPASNKDPVLADGSSKVWCLSGQLTQLEGGRANLGRGGAGSEPIPVSTQ